MSNPANKVNQVNELLESGGQPYRLAFKDPRELKLVEKNARYMDKEMFDQLVSNIRRDGGLSSMPLCHLDTTTGEMTVLSGNHRVLAAREAGLSAILVMYIDRKLTRGEAVAIQLSHNAIAGKDDMATLKSLWTEIEEMELKRYAGLDSEALAELDKLEFVTISEAHFDTRVITLAFLPEDAEAFRQAVADADVYFQGDENYLLARSHYESVFELVADVKEKFNIVSNSIAFMKLVELARAQMDVETSG